MNDIELKGIIEKSRNHLPDPNKHAKQGKAKLYRVPPIPSIEIETDHNKKSNIQNPYYEVEFELVQTGRNRFSWEYKILLHFNRK